MTRLVRDEDGTRYVLEKRSSDSSRVRDVETGQRCHLPNADLEPVDGVEPLAAAAETVPEAVRALVTGVATERGLGLLVELDTRGPTDVRSLLGATDCCESDLHGTLLNLQAAGLVAEVEVGGERGYELTDTASDALTRLR